MAVNTAGLNGEVHKGATVYSDDPGNKAVKLSLTGEVKPYVEVAPRSSLYLVADRGTSMKQTLKITAAEGEHMKILTENDNLNGAATYKVNEVQPNKEYTLEVDSSPEKEPGRYSGYIELVTDHPKKQTVKIHVNVDIRGDVLVSPPNVFFGNIDPSAVGNAPLQRRLMIVRKGGKELKLTHVKFDEKKYQVTINQLQEGKTYEMIVTPRLENFTPGVYRDEIMLRTDVDTQPVVNIPLTMSIIEPPTKTTAAPAQK